MVNRQVVLFLFVLILLTSSVSALLDVSANTNGIKVDVPKFDYLKNNQSFNVTVFTYNVTDGKNLAGSNCSLQLFNHTGTKVYNVPNLTSFGTGYNHFIARGNFTTNDDYYFTIYCENTIIGGFATGLYSINNVGSALLTQQSIIYATFFFLLIFFFCVNLIVITKMPLSNVKDPTGQIINVVTIKYITMVFVFIEWLFIVAILFISSNLAQAYLVEQLFANFLFMLWRISIPMTGIFIVLWLIWIIANVVSDKEIKNMVTRGLPGTGGEKQKWQK